MAAKKNILAPLMGGEYVLLVRLGDDTYREVAKSQWGPFWTELWNLGKSEYGEENISYEFRVLTDA